LGSPIFDLEPYAEAINIVLQFISKIKGAEDWFQLFSPGGGFAISYTESQIPPRPIDYASTIVSSLVDGCAEFGLRQPELVIEPGRSITGPAGVAIYSVGAIKEIPEVRIYSSVDGGMGDNIRPALYGASYEVIAATRLFETPTTRMTISGKFCESGDILVKDALLPSLKSGDLIAIPASGAYSPSMASNYNMNPRPPIVLVNNGKSSVMRRRETLEDMLICDL
jgi:diaminopimelate decarboxylase